ncbi:tRNA (adenosine(37)-N6)-threonylcarbamoyltransferase complex transferase subunit TsaD [Buchnera aphidicola]|uniref:tRNA (adenosine(37)-N6)-threonylcarbamoyltransferase complex transferase subunit TsaD n=1 Tax=Buchnera aphidicola TaxID=9 RepID=UPI003463C807
MRILGIETSFDDTGVAIYDSDLGLLINKLFHQSNIHYKYGGVVPELAAREYVHQVAPLIKSILQKENILSSIDGIAYTGGPGLSGSILVGAAVSCSLAYSCNIPSIPIHHMEGHLLSVMLEKRKPQFPFVALLVSGKHTQLIDVCSFGDYKILGETLDDAVGEVFDKVAQKLNLGYPGGALLSQFAKIGKLRNLNFPKPMKYHMNLDFSFSGLKTFTMNLIHKHFNDKNILHDIAFGFEDSVFDVLSYKSFQALKLTGYNKLVVAGGVSSNQKLIFKLKNMLKKYNKKLYFSRSEFCTDNAAMIAYVGMLYLKRGWPITNNIFVNPKWSILDIKKTYSNFYNVSDIL